MRKCLSVLAQKSPLFGFYLGQTYLMFCCSSPAGQNFSIFVKFDRVIELLHALEASSQMARLWLSVEVVSGCTVLFGSRIINCYQEETFGNLLSRLEEDKFSDSDFLFLFTGHPGLLCD